MEPEQADITIVLLGVWECGSSVGRCQRERMIISNKNPSRWAVYRAGVGLKERQTCEAYKI